MKKGRANKRRNCYRFFSFSSFLNGQGRVENRSRASKILKTKQKIRVFDSSNMKSRNRAKSCCCCCEWSGLEWSREENPWWEKRKKEMIQIRSALSRVSIEWTLLISAALYVVCKRFLFLCFFMPIHRMMGADLLSFSLQLRSVLFCSVLLAAAAAAAAARLVVFEWRRLMSNAVPVQSWELRFHAP